MKRWAGWLWLLPAILAGPIVARADETPRPIRALLVLGGCCHDYKHQKDLLTRGISARTYIDWTVAYDPSTSNGHQNPLYDNPDWAKGFDIVVHDECSSNVNKDMAVIDRILAPHKNGLPGVVLHCGMHSYRTEGWQKKATPWQQFIGVVSTGHGPQMPIAVTFVDKANPITEPFKDWTTVNEELYNNAIGHLEPTAHALARGKQSGTGPKGRKVDAESVVVWTNIYNEKARVFSTTLGHNNATVSDPRYLDLVTRGLLWAVGKLDEKHLKADAAMVPEDHARGRKAVASTTQGADHAPGAAVDGNPETRWCASDDSAPQWWQVDLGQARDLTGVRILWEQDGVNYRYRIQGSEDGKEWMTLSDQSKTSSRDQDRTHPILARGIRHLRIDVLGLRPGAWASIYEVEVHGTEKVPAPAGTVLSRPLQRAGDGPTLGEIRIPEGFRATVFAQPPDVSYPTCLATSPGGEVFVGIDENGSLDARPGRGRVVRCIDSNNDGRADRFNVFATMDSPRGLAYDDGTLYVLHPPELTAYHDENHDGTADRSETLVKGIGFDLKFRGADHTTNGIRLGIDGYIYIAVGDYGFLHAVGKDGRALPYRGGGVVRVRTDGTGLEPVSRGQRNIYDVAIDPYMNLFTRDNTNDGDGWDVRLSHLVPSAHMGYPSLFKNFADEMVKPLADYGGGSPTGSIYINEPSLPNPFGDALYTCEWGREAVFRHPLDREGASFRAGQEMFIKLPRPTDIEVDGLGRIYVASWKGATFTYAGPNVGYVIRVTAPGSTESPIPDLKKATDDQLVGFLASPSQVMRLAASRAILRRGNRGGIASKLEAMARGNGRLASRVAAIFTLEQLLGADSIDLLTRLSEDPSLREFALTALSDRKEGARIPAAPFLRGLLDRNPRVRLRAAVGLGRLGKTEAADELVARMADDDPMVAHVAVKALVALHAVEACLKALDAKTPDLAAGAAQALQAMHDRRAVDGLIARLSSTDPTTRRLAFRTLCRLDHREAEYRGDWWGTRPDTSGPYYKPETWEQTSRIEQALGQAMTRADSREAAVMLIDLVRNKVELKGASTLALDIAGLDAAGRASAVGILATRRNLSASDVEFLERIAFSDREPEALRARAIAGLQRDWAVGFRVLSKIGGQDSPPAAFVAAWRDFVRDRQQARHLSDLRREVKSDDANRRELAFAILLPIAENARARGNSRAEAGKLIESAWKDPRQSSSLLRAIGRMDAVAYALHVRSRMADRNPEVRAAAGFASGLLGLDEDASRDRGPKIASLPYESVVSTAVKEKGDPRRGERLFQRQGCVACHAVAPGEPARGPSLLGISTRYSRADLAESILRPSAKIAQGFEPQSFATADGRTFAGFVVRESGDEVEIRDAQGTATILSKKEIDERARGTVSIMPVGLVDTLTPPDLASLLAYLESLKAH